MVTVNDVAAKSNVSIATVSRVINQTANVKEETRKKVLQAIEELGFVPGPFALGVIKQVSRSIGLLLPQVTTPAFAHLVSGVENMARTHGFTLYICSTNYSTEVEHKSIRQLLLHYVGGVIVASGTDDERTRKILLESRRPAIFINREWHSQEFDSFYTDRLTSGLEAYKYLVSLGHKKIGVLMGDFETQGNHEKLEGILLAAAEQGRKINPELVLRCKDSTRGGFEGMNRLLVNNRVTAMIAFSDVLAMGGIRAAINAGFEVPREISFICLNNTDVAQNYYPALTSIDINLEELGKLACQRLFTRLSAKKKLPTVKRKIAPSLTVRDSCITPIRY